ncbi:hypothetical protein DS745_09220 [Anaerobacillus alkaliphilus]|uniref:Copper amine oxidase n=1 Tax=Anaerobacillus alkaliphilus TaxID=1548597 RepID=A0A4Q0VU06_9BACI|nr:stalk domain-containing protein [Anaerobacillus alkaliphilus]RXJ01651.1 hypothetical protein DS745_09220 [Anaerobacillus alkaliphilus]
MGKFVTFGSLLLFIMIGFQTQTASANTIQVFVDGKKIHFSDMMPIIENGRVLVPLRAVQEGFGSNINWDQQTRMITSVKDKGSQQTKLIYQIDSPYVLQHYQNGNQQQQMVEKIDVPAKLVQNRTMVPLRSTTESMGYSVQWSQKDWTVTIKSNPSIKPIAGDLQYPVSGESEKLVEMEFDIFFLTNAERVKHGVKPLILDLEVNQVARKKSQDMHDQRYFAHRSPVYGSPFDMLTHFGITYRSAGENIAAGYQSAQAVVTGWMNSEGHRKNILNSRFERIGVGYYYGANEYRSYYTQMFLTK